MVSADSPGILVPVSLTLGSIDKPPSSYKHALGFFPNSSLAFCSLSRICLGDGVFVRFLIMLGVP